MFDKIEISARYFVFTCGEGNDFFIKKLNLSASERPLLKTQKRPLQMLLLKPFPFPLYAHCVDLNVRPRLTITSYPIEDGFAWYCGGDIAEKGAHMTPEDLYEYGKRELATLLPWLSLKNLKWKTCFVNRAEPWQADGNIPALPTFTQHENQIFAWPVKLAYAPLLADNILNLFQKINFMPSHHSAVDLSFQKPSVALPPWQEEKGWN